MPASAGMTLGLGGTLRHTGNQVDVYTTINIQHIESLNDVIAQITRTRVREIVPDSVMDKADAIELIDLTPDDLIQRLKEGKVNVPEQAERALKNYFSPANLTALRELALRRTAERVDEQLLKQMQVRAIQGPWAAGERILVCVSEDLGSGSLVRLAKRLADRLHAPWTALNVESRRHLQIGEDGRARIAATLRLAGRLGGEVVTIPAELPKIADDILAIARNSNATHIIVGKSNRSRWFEMLHGSVVHDLVRGAGNIGIHVIADDNGPAPSTDTRELKAQSPLAIQPLPYFIALLAVTLAVGIGMALKPFIGIGNVDLVLLTAIVGVAVRYGLWPSIFASVAASLCCNFFFLPPIYTFTISDPTNVVAFFRFIALSIVVSHLAARGQMQAVVSRERTRAVDSLYTFSRKLSGAGSLDDVLWATAPQIALMLTVRVVILLPENGAVTVRAGYPPEDSLDYADLAAAKWAWEKNRAAGRDSDTLPGAKWLFLPMRTGRDAIGILGITGDTPGHFPRAEQMRLIDALTDLGALAIERVHLVEDVDQVKRIAATDRLRSALLTSISHDLKTPLASVLGAACALRDLGHSLGDDAKFDLVATIIEEPERLNRFINNLARSKLNRNTLNSECMHDESLPTALQR